MFELTAAIHKILPPKRVSNDHYVLPVIISHDLDGKLQYRYMQVVRSGVKEKMAGITVGDKVKIKFALKGKEKGDIYYNLDEITGIEKLN